MAHQNVALPCAALRPQQRHHMCHGALMVANTLASRQRTCEDWFNERQGVERHFTVRVSQNDGRKLIQRASHCQPLLFEDAPAKGQTLSAIVVPGYQNDRDARANDQARQNVIK